MDLKQELVGLNFYKGLLIAITKSEIIEIEVPHVQKFKQQDSDSSLQIQKSLKVNPSFAHLENETETENKTENQEEYIPGFKSRVLSKLKGEISTQAAVNPVTGEIFMLIESLTGRKRQIGYLHMDTATFEYSEHINRTVRQIIIDFKSPKTIFLRFRYKISKLEFANKKMNKSYFSINKIRHFDFIKNGELVIINEKTNLKVFTKDWKIISIIHLDGNPISKIWSSDLFCIM